MKNLKLTFQVAGVDAVLVRCGEVESLELTQHLVQLRHAILNELESVVKEVVPAYTTLLVYYEPRLIRLYDLELAVEQIVASTTFKDTAHNGKTIEVPVCYGGQYGPDLERVAKQAKLTPEEVISRHADCNYTVSALGFAPGFAYLSGLPKELETPRLASPRKKVVAGSLGIAGIQTAVYPVAGPGGWNIIGRAHQSWFDLESDPMTPVEAGDTVKFYAVSEQDFKALELGGQS
ncbi:MULTISPECIES: 5-oxoprolinase subunit PxpB [Gammaproteobacteria]|uniref:5-oxoprolinase subunit PxpB n=1 Tax=Gammaproteobacteria TaxID=1236 RepID=UPI001402D27E|nr:MULTISPECIES: 5-oxoprolinase subunit PxpB [Gammaproteobacteria]